MSRTGSVPHRTAAIAARRRSSLQPQANRLDSALPPILSICVGLSLSLIAVGFLESTYRLLDDSALTFQISALAMALFFAFGLRHPYRAAVWAGPIVQRMLRPLALANHPPSMHPSRPDQRRWVLAGGAALLAGLSALASPTALSIAGGGLDWATANFCWTTPARIVIEAVVILGMALIPFTCAGLLVRCVHHTWVTEDVASVHRWSWMLGGSAVGFCLLALKWPIPFAPAALFRAGAIPLLAAAILAVARTAPNRVRGKAAAAREPQEPDIDDPWPTVLRLGVGVAAGCAIVAGLNWAHVLAATHAGSQQASLLAGSAMIVAFASGVAIAGSRRREADHRIGSFGAQCAWIGAGLAAGTSLFAIVSRQSYAPFRETPGHALLWLICAALPLMALGHAVGYGFIAVGRRIAPDDGGICRFGQKVTLVAGVAAAVVAVPLFVRFGSYVTLVSVSLALLACGGILIIHDPAHDSARRRRHVVAVFGAVFCMTALMPTAGRGWLTSRRSAGDALEYWSGAYEFASDGQLRLLNAAIRPTEMEGDSPVPLPVESIDWHTFSERPRVCIISHHGAHDLQSLRIAGSVQRRFVLDPGAHAASSSRRTGRDGQWSILDESPEKRVEALRALRCSQDRFDLIVVSLMDAPPASTARFLSPESLRHLADYLVADGVILVLTAPGSAISVDAAQLARAYADGESIHVESTDLSVAGQTCRAWLISFEPQVLARLIGASDPGRVLADRVKSR